MTKTLYVITKIKYAPWSCKIEEKEILTGYTDREMAIKVMKEMEDNLPYDCDMEYSIEQVKYI